MSETKETTNSLSELLKAKNKSKKKKAATPEPIPLMAGALPLNAVKFDTLVKEARRITLEHRAALYKTVLDQAAENKSLAEVDAAATHLSRDFYLDVLDQDVKAFTLIHDQAVARYSDFAVTYREGLPIDNAFAAYLSQQVAAAYQMMLLAIDNRANLVNQRNARPPVPSGPVGGVAPQVKNAKPDEV